MFKRTMILGSFVVLGGIFLVGCSEYITPGRGADMAFLAGQGGQQEISNANDVAIEQLKPTAKFPANVVVVRVQEPNYRSRTSSAYGNGNFSVMTTLDVETDEDFSGLAQSLPDLAQVGRLNRILLPRNLQSDKDLRQAAAKLMADMILIYTIYTTFSRVDTETGLTVISLGFWGTIDIRVSSTASAILMDTRTGYIYGALDRTSKVKKRDSAFNESDEVDQIRQQTEREAFEKLIESFKTAWPAVVAEYKK